MNKTQAKKLIQEHGLYHAIVEIAYTRAFENDDLKEIVFRVLDEIPEDILKKAIKKGTR